MMLKRGAVASCASPLKRARRFDASYPDDGVAFAKADSELARWGARYKECSTSLVVAHQELGAYVLGMPSQSYHKAEWLMSQCIRIRNDAHSAEAEKRKAENQLSSESEIKKRRTFQWRVIVFCVLNDDIFHFIVNLFQPKRALNLSFPAVLSHDLTLASIVSSFQLDGLLTPELVLKFDRPLEGLAGELDDILALVQHVPTYFGMLFNFDLDLVGLHALQLEGDNMNDPIEVEDFGPMYRNDGRLTLNGISFRLATTMGGLISPPMAEKIVQYYFKHVALGVGQRGSASVMGQFVLKYKRQVEKAQSEGVDYKPATRSVALPTDGPRVVTPKDLLHI
jgi:hypothetical protein